MEWWDIVKVPVLPYAAWPITATFFLQTSGVDQWASLGVGGILAGVFFYYYREDRKRSEDMLKRILDEYGSTLKANTQAVTTLTEVIRQTHPNIDK